MAVLVAADTKISCRVRDEEDCVLSQKDLAHIINWIKDWHLDFNREKCKIMRISQPPTDYKVNGVKLQKVEEEKDLGITVANSLKPSSQ